MQKMFKNSKSFNTIVLSLAMASTIFFNSCKSDHDDHDHNHSDQELITTVRLTYTNTNNVSEKVVATYKDLDGAGGAAPVIDNLRLKPNTSYSVMTEVLNDSKNPSENITAEILAKGTEHQFFYTISPAALLAITYTDKDSKNLPIGLATAQRTGAAGTGTLRVTLKHQTNNSKTATSTINTGATDIDVTFPLRVE
jgi:hypothetical protein